MSGEKNPGKRCISKETEENIRGLVVELLNRKPKKWRQGDIAAVAGAVGPSNVSRLATGSGGTSYEFAEALCRGLGLDVASLVERGLRVAVPPVAELRATGKWSEEQLEAGVRVLRAVPVSDPTAADLEDAIAFARDRWDRRARWVCPPPPPPTEKPETGVALLMGRTDEKQDHAKRKRKGRTG